MLLELDLDYLERGGVGNMTVGGAPSVEPSPDSLDLVKVVFLGAPAVGKTSIIQVCNQSNKNSDLVYYITSDWFTFTKVLCFLNIIKTSLILTQIQLILYYFNFFFFQLILYYFNFFKNIKDNIYRILQENSLSDNI